MSESISVYEEKWAPEKIEKLREKIRAFEFPRQPKDAGWKYGCDPKFLDELRTYWADGYDFQKAQDNANKFPQFLAEVEAGVQLHFVHVVGEAKGQRPLLLAHGWPSAVYEYWKIIEPLAYPSRFGGSADEAFDIVVPTLPGYGASFKPEAPVASEETAKWYDKLMQMLGYKTYYIHGTDIGSDVVWKMAAAKPEVLRGLHLNNVKMNKTISIWPLEFKWLLDSKKADKSLGAYFQLQMTRPESLAYAMSDNPVGQLAWIVERFHDWSDLRYRAFETLYSKDELLNFVMNYYMTGSFATSVWFYYARGQRDSVNKKIEVATGASFFPDPRTPPAPKTFVERNFNLVHWDRPSVGGHFAALEEPLRMTTILRDWAKACEPDPAKLSKTAPSKSAEKAAALRAAEATF